MQEGGKRNFKEESKKTRFLLPDMRGNRLSIMMIFIAKVHKKREIKKHS